MKPEERDKAYLWDMLDAARHAKELITDVSFDELMEDVRTRYALERRWRSSARRRGVYLRHYRPDTPQSHGKALLVSGTSWPMNTVK